MPDIFRDEYRLDGSAREDGAVARGAPLASYTFRNDTAGNGRTHQPSLGLEAIVRFPERWH